MRSLILRPFSEFIQEPLILVGLIMLTVGVAVICSARNIARTVKKTRDIKSNDKAFIIPFAIGILLFLAGVLCVILGIFGEM